MLARMLRFKLSLFIALGVATQTFAVSWIVPSDRFEIERASAIVIGRVLGSHHGAEVVTDIALEEAIKGDVANVIRVHEPNGIPGVPQFIDGDRVLLLLYLRDDGTYTVSDLQLGAFHLDRDLALRDASEISGWDVKGDVYVEPYRAAEPFLAYVRSVVRGELVVADYFVAKPVTHFVAQSVNASATYTGTSYMMAYNGGRGTRWNVFPSAVNWNQGNSETGPLGSGTPQITAAFAAWNAGGTNYVLSGAKANSNGFLDAADGVNNFVFEKNLTSAGVQPFNCTSGGALGMGGMKTASFGAGVHVFNGETYATTTEADVSMNVGIGNCTTTQVTPDQFKSVIVHELGHTLGFRHSDQNRSLTAACSTDITLQCSNSALMNHILISGLNGKLQAWDTAALSSVYGTPATPLPPPCTPPSITAQPVSAAITSGSSAQLFVGANGTAPLTYQWYTGASGDTSLPIAGSSTLVVQPTLTTSYWARVTGACGPAANSSAATVSVITCPAVALNTLTATAAGDGYDLSVIAAGGASFTYRWYENGAKEIGTGNPLHVNPSVTTSYACRVTNNCGKSAESGSVTITVAPKAARRRPAQH
jgi:hypothetical protein